MSCVYLARVVHNENVAYKIGFTTRSPKRRAYEVGVNGKYQTELVEFVELPENGAQIRIAKIVESTLHTRYTKKRYKGIKGREIFRLTSDDVVNFGSQVQSILKDIEEAQEWIDSVTVSMEE